jgi:hypothetical protein
MASKAQSGNRKNKGAAANLAAGQASEKAKSWCHSHSLTLLVFAVSLFLSASLMFAVQPMVGKMLLPLAGGTPASWIVAMAFFQIALLMGYMLAWMMSRFHIRTHTLLLVGLLGLGFIFLPVRIADYASILETGGIAPGTIFTVLLFAIGLPFTALSTVSSTLQRLFTATSHKDAQDPYFLYAASNAGSLIGLLSYPLLIEPLFALQDQSAYWQILYGGLIVMCLVCLGFTNRKEEKTAEKKVEAAAKADDEEITWHQRTTWLMLAFFPSSLLMGTTMHITMDVVSAPLLWVLPLGIYLVTHIMAFSRKKIIARETLYSSHAIAVCAIVLLSVKFPELQLITASWNGVIVSLVSFFLIALGLHTYLAENRPHNKHLTQFYFFLALGGALGGSFNAFLSPVIFNDILEYPLVAIASCAMNPYFRTKVANSDMTFFTIGLALMFLYVAGLHFDFFNFSLASQEGGSLFQVYFLVMAFTLMVNVHAKLGLYVSAVLFFVMLNITATGQRILTLERNFFGVMQVADIMTPVNGPDEEPKPVRFFMHGTTLHGLQKLDVDLKTSPITSYYGPLMTAIDAYKPAHVGLIGLGAGTIRCYHAPERHYTIYEIDPAVVDIANKYFDYLKDCGDEKDVIVVGDGRLEMEKRQDDKYDMMILDAFSSDSIPVHLITEEAFALYKNRLTENGVIALHISNRYLDLKYAIAATAAKTGMTATFIHQMQVTDPLQVFSIWVILTPPQLDLSPLFNEGWMMMPPEDFKTDAWTDEHSNILSVLSRYNLF